VNGDRGFSEASLIDMDELNEGNDVYGMPGSGRDEGGCIPSAGYRWCASMGKCVRPWEEDGRNCPELVLAQNKIKDRIKAQDKKRGMKKCGMMGCNNSGGPDEGGWDSGFGANGTQYGEQFTMVDTPTSLNDPQRLANKVPGTGRTVSEHCTSYLDENGYLTNACNFKKHEDETDPTDADFDRQLPEPAFETKRGHGRILDPVTVTGRTRNHGLQGGWH
jgi:hypothetical protein